VYITGYGRQDEKGTAEQQSVLQHCSFVTPGQCIELCSEVTAALMQHENTLPEGVLAMA
jgi:hypothetical protein